MCGFAPPPLFFVHYPLESLSATSGPSDENENDRLNLFAVTQTGPLDDYIQDFPRPSLTALDKHSRAQLFVRGLSDGLCADAMREHPRTLSEAICAAQTARRNTVLARPRDRLGVVGIDEPWTQLTWLRLSNRSLASDLKGRS